MYSLSLKDFIYFCLEDILCQDTEKLKHQIQESYLKIQLPNSLFTVISRYTDPYPYTLVYHLIVLLVGWGNHPTSINGLEQERLRNGMDSTFFSSTRAMLYSTMMVLSCTSSPGLQPRYLLKNSQMILLERNLLDGETFITDLLVTL